MLLKEELAKEAARRTWAAVLVQAIFRGKVGRWLGRAKKQVDANTRTKLSCEGDVPYRW